MSELTSVEKAEFVMALKSQAKMEVNLQALVDSSHAVALEQGLLLGQVGHIAEDISDVKDHLAFLNGKVVEHEQKIHKSDIDRTQMESKVMVKGIPVNEAVSNLKVEWRVWGIVAGLAFTGALALLHVYG